MELFKGLEPESFWKHFYNITRIPRGSGNEAGVRAYVSSFAEEHHLDCSIDATGNIIVRKPASPGKEKSPSVVLQGHMDMVCEKNRGNSHDFLKDPISLLIDDGWLKADGTTLGADNGVAIAYGLSVLETEEALGPVELLLTVDEEVGLTGAMGLDPSLVHSRILINLDSEEEGILYVGCAGGLTTEGYLSVDFEKIPDGYKAFSVELTGLRGGHSGSEIHLGFGNAVSLCGRFLWNVLERFDARVAFLEGGGKHNAIPRECFATVYIKETQSKAFTDYAEEFCTTITSEFKQTEPDLLFSVVSGGKAVYKSGYSFSLETAEHIVNLIYSIPHGVIKMSNLLDGLVETSTNLARVELLLEGKGVEGCNTNGKTEFFVLTCQRSSVDSESRDVADRIRACIYAAKGRSEFKHAYPGWEPDPDSMIVELAKKIYAKTLKKEPEVKAIHAGLECGVIGKKFDSLDMISFGPELANVHTPGEKMNIESVEKTWKFLIELLKSV